MKRLLSRLFGRKSRSARKPAARRPQLGIEALESRLAPAVSYALSGGILYATGDNNSNIFDVDHIGSTTYVNGFSAPDSAVYEIRITCGSAVDQVYVNATARPLTIQGGGGRDYVRIGNAFGNAQNVREPVNVINTPWYTDLVIENGADTSVHNVLISQQGIAGLTPAPGGISYTAADLGSLTIRGGNPNARDTYTFVNTPSSGVAGGLLTKLYTAGQGANVFVQRTTGALEVQSLAGNPSVTVGDNGSVQNIQGALKINAVNGTAAVTVDNSADNTFRTGTVDTFSLDGARHGRIYGLVPAPIHYRTSGTSSVTVHTGTAGGVVNLRANDRPTSLVGHGPNTTVNIGDGGRLTNILAAVTVTNPPSYTAVNVDDSADPFARAITLDTVSLADGNYGRISFGGVPIQYKYADTNGVAVLGGLGNDTFRVLDSGPFTLVTLDGGAGNDIMVGGARGETLRGGPGRDLAIGGLGADVLAGNAGEDILIDGTTAYDANPTALAAVMAEWTRTDLPYLDRVYHLLDGGGLNGSTLLNLSTFATDGVANTLTGASDLDLFYGSRARDSHDWDQSIGEIFVDPDGIQAPIRIDARGLTGPYVWVDYVAHESASTFQVTLTPGQHAFWNYGGSTQYFEVAADGTISYDPALEGMLSGQGTRTLVITGRAVQIDATALSNPYLWVNYTSFDSSAPFTANLLPGQHAFWNYGGSTQYFNVAVDGTVSYDAAMEGLVSGQGTTSLTIHGRAVAIDATALSNPYLWVDYASFESAAPRTVSLLPGQHAFWNYGGSTQYFTMASDGTIGYEAAMEGIVSGQGTSSMTINGLAVTIDASALTGTYLWVDYTSFESATARTVRVLPGQHAFWNYGGSTQYFNVAVDGTVSYDASLEGIVTGQGTTSLTILGREVTIDATARGASYLWVDYTSIDPTAPVTVRLLPGQHGVWTSDSPVYAFTVGVDGTIDYAAALDSVFSGRGTSGLTFLP